METLQKVSLFWDVRDLDPRKHAQFIIERILAYGDESDFNWAIDFYGKEKVKDYFLKSKTLDRKSLSFWCQYFNLNKKKCIQKQLTQKQSVFLKR